MRNRVLYTKPSITELEVSYVTDAARHGWGARCYEYIERFERGFEQHLGVAHAIATSSCTGALHMGLAALGVGKGDEVIVPETTWIATAVPVTYLGARPVFVDVLPDTWCLDPARVEAAITPRTRAIIAVHVYGNVCDMAALQAIADRHGLPLIEDAAEALGSQWQGRAAGSVGRFATFSFHGTKTMTTGEGGMFVTQDAELYERVMTLSNHGRARGNTRQFWPDMVGFKYKMSNLQAAVGCAQLERLPELIAQKRRIFQTYQARFANLPVRMNPEPDGVVNGYWMPSIVCDAGSGVEREALLQAFAREDIDGRVFFWPLSSLPMFESCPHHTVAADLAARSVNLPSYHDMSLDDVERVVSAVRSLF